MSTSPAFEKYADKLVPAVVQDASSLKILMLGFMTQAALATPDKTYLFTF